MQMDAAKDDMGMAPDCWCKMGKMVVKEAGPRSPNWKRTYYKCPMNRDDHPKHFIWVDEYRSRQNGNRARTTTIDSGCNSRTQITQTASSMSNPMFNDSETRSRIGVASIANEPQFAISFMRVVLVMLGVIIGLLLAKMV